MSTDPIQLQYPIVLIHGLGARSTYGPFEYFYGLPKLLKDAKNQVFIPNLTSWNTVEHRAQQLKKQLEQAIPDGKFNLVGHSMGGLDARYLTAKLGLAERVASVTTIGTPNRGTSVGDLAFGFLPHSALKQITREHCSGEFSECIKKVPNVAYYSATTAIINPIIKNALPIFWIPYKILAKTEGDNDGFVSVESAIWGEHICTYAGDHYAQIGQFLGRSRGMDYMKFYREIFTRLKRDGM